MFGNNSPMNMYHRGHYKIKSFSEKYDPKIPLKEIEPILEDFIIFIGRYYFIC